MDFKSTPFALAQLSRLLGSDVVINDKTAKKAGWLQLFLGMASGTVVVGSRQPVKDVPVWATLEVLHGGFASGNLCSALVAGDASNASFFTEDGARRLSEMLDTGCYRLQCAEHGALLVVVWLLRSGCVDEATVLVAEITPYFERLRFYPYPAEAPVEPTPLVSVCTVRDVITRLAEVNPSRSRCASAAALAWLPMKHELIELFLLTLGCPHHPGYVCKEEPRVLAFGDAKFVKKGKIGLPRTRVMHKDCPWHDVCGQPLQHFPLGWMTTAEAALLKYNTLSQGFKEGSSRHTLVTCLEASVASGGVHPVGLEKNFHSRLHDLLADYNSTRGKPGTETLQLYFTTIQNAATQVTVPVSSFIPELYARLKQYPQGRGLPNPDDVLGDIKLGDTLHPVPLSLKNLVCRAREDTLGNLISLGLVSSSEMLAALVPGLSAEASSVGFEDPVLRRLSYAIRVAFRSRRSLLLRGLEHQVTLDELPWAAAIQRRFTDYAAARSGALCTLKLIVTQALCAFPQTMLPNKLLQSCRELVTAAGIEHIPLVDEIAADIFEGRFSLKFLAAARIAARSLGRDLYAHYYGLDAAYKRILEEDGMTADAFGTLCFELAGVVQGRWSGAAANGKVIERQQLLTTPNLAVLTQALDLQLDWATLATKTWVWFVNALSNVPEDYVSRLRLRKDAAYAWRQLVYYVSRLSLAANQNDLLKTLAHTATKERAHLHCVTTFLFPLVQAAGRLSPAQVAVFGWTTTTDTGDCFFPCV